MCWAYMVSILKNTTRYNFVKNVGGLMILVLYVLSDNALYLDQYLWKYLQRF